MRDTIIRMNESARAITWEAPEHHHVEKGSDWFWVVGIIAVAGATAAFFFGNFLFAILILVAAVSLSLVALRQPKVIPFSVSTRGIRVDENIYPYAALESFYIDTVNYAEPQLLVKSKKLYMPLIVMPIPEEYMDEIDDILSERLPEEELEEPLVNVLLEFFGF